MDPDRLLNNSKQVMRVVAFSRYRGGGAFREKAWPHQTPPTLTLALALGPGRTLLFTLQHREALAGCSLRGAQGRRTNLQVPGQVAVDRQALLQQHPEEERPQVRAGRSSSCCPAAWQQLLQAVLPSSSSLGWKHGPTQTNTTSSPSSSQSQSQQQLLTHLDTAEHTNPPGLHPAFGPQRSDLGLQEGLEVVLHRQGVLLLHLVAAELHSHQVAEQVPADSRDLQPGAELELLRSRSQQQRSSSPELVVPHKLLPGAHHSFARLLLVFILRAVSVSLL